MVDNGSVYPLSHIAREPRAMWPDSHLNAGAHPRIPVAPTTTASGQAGVLLVVARGARGQVALQLGGEFVRARQIQLAE